MRKSEFNKLDWKKRFTYLKSSPFDEKDLGKRIKFQIIRFLPDTQVGPHFHKKLTEIFYIRKGKGTIIFNKQKYEAMEDGIFLCQPKDVHEIINNSDRELIILNFKINENPGDIFWLNEEDKKNFASQNFCAQSEPKGSDSGEKRHEDNHRKPD